jgi:hypothetical protein
MNSDTILSTISRVFADEGNPFMVNILASSESELSFIDEHKSYND